MSRLFLFVFLFLFIDPIQSQVSIKDTTLHSYNKAIVWRGFNHLWSYNHRINRLGCQVKMDKNDSAKMSYYSATGLGSDSTFYTIYYSSVSSPYLRFYEGEININVSGKETQLLHENKEISIEIPAWFQKQTHYKAIINGFDLKSKAKSDLPILLEIHLEDPTVFNENTLKLNVNTNWVANCRSAECSIVNNTTNYEIKIHYLLIGYQNNDAFALESFNKKSYAWTVDIVPPYEPMLKEKNGLPNLYENAIIGIKSIGFVLNEEQWLQELHYEIGLKDYNAITGNAHLNMGMQFLGWKEGMKSQAVSKSKAIFSHRKPGWVSMNLNAVMLQFKKGNTEDGIYKGQMFWPGWNVNAGKTNSIDENWIYLKYK